MEKPRISYTEFAAARMTYEKGSIADFLERRWRDSLKPGARPLGKSSVFSIRRIQRTEFAKLDAAKITSQELIDYARVRRSGDAPVKPATVNADISIIRGTLRHFADIDELPMTALDVFKKVKKRLEREQLIGKADARTYIPPEEVLDQCNAVYEASNKFKRTKIDMVVVQTMLRYTGRRISELTRLEYGHVNVEKRTCLLFDLKNSAGKGKYGKFALLGPAWELVQERMRVLDEQIADQEERKHARLFPWNPQSISQRGTQARKKAGVVGMHTHDLRAKCFTDLLKAGVPFIKVQKCISLHEGDAKTLVKHYARFEAEDLHDDPAIGGMA